MQRLPETLPYTAVKSVSGFSQRLGGLCLFFLVIIREVATWGVVAMCQTASPDTAGITSFNLKEPVRKRLSPHFTDAGKERAKTERLPEGTRLENKLS